MDTGQILADILVGGELKVHLIGVAGSGMSGIAGLLYLYYNQFVSPQTVALSASAEALLMVIAGAALVIIMKDVASAYIERWNFMLGAIFVLIVVFMPDGLVPGCTRLWRRARTPRGSRTPTPAPTPTLERDAGR